MLIQLSAAQAIGFVMKGDGRARSIIDSRTCTTSPNVFITCTIPSCSFTGDGVTVAFTIPTASQSAFGLRAVSVNGINAAPNTYSLSGSTLTFTSAPANNAAIIAYPAQDNDYVTIEDIGFVSGINGTGFQIGRTDFLDPINVPHLSRCNIQNFNTGGSAIALQLNYVLGGRFDTIVNGAGVGFAAMDLRQACFNKFGGSTGTSTVGVMMRDGSNYGNEWSAPDFENTAICVEAASGTPQSNKFGAGTWSWSTVAFNDLAGSNNLIEVPNPNPVTGTSLQSFIGGRGTGVRVDADAAAMGISPSSFAFTTGSPSWTNNTGFDVVVYLSGTSDAQSIEINGYSFPYTAGVGHRLRPGHTIQANSFTTAPTVGVLWA